MAISSCWPNLSFEAGSWGGEFNPEFSPQKGDAVIKEHWAQSGFANTDLDLQLKQHGIQKIVLVGLVANSCIESTGRFGMELGYHVTLVTDATAAFSSDGMKAAATNASIFAHAILTTEALIPLRTAKRPLEPDSELMSSQLILYQSRYAVWV